jgi:DNA helicase HerA-like ATPase
MIPEQVLEDAIFTIGKVVSVEGRTIRVKVDKTKNPSHLIYKGELLRNVSVGGYVKILKGFTKIIGKVEGEYVSEDKFYAKDKDYRSDRDLVDRVLTVSLLGFFNGPKFERGIKEMPLVDNECFLLQKKEFEEVHDFVKKEDEPVIIGTLSFEKGQEIRVGVNSLFASHIGIFGNTGSGKSYTLAKIYRELFLKFCDKDRFKQAAEFVIFDFNGEYTDPESEHDDIIVDEKYKKVYRLSTRAEDGDAFPVTAETVRDSEFWTVFLEATEKTQAPFLKRAIGQSYIAGRIAEDGGLKSLLLEMVRDATTSPEKGLDRSVVINLLREVSDALGGNESIDALQGSFDAHLKFNSTLSRFYWQTGTQQIYADQNQFVPTAIDANFADVAIDQTELGPLNAVRLQIVLQYYADIIRGFANREHLAPLIKRLDKRIDHLKKVIVVQEPEAKTTNITVISLRDVNLEMRKVLPLLFCKKLYNDKKEQKDDSKYLNIIIDEAHNILSEQSERESVQWKDYRLETFEEIIKEGRKFGVFLTVASQRPADISPTIISQLHNYFLHRLINHEDISAVRQTISYLDKVSFEYVPLLPTGTCIVAGLLANVPIVVDIGTITPDKHAPKNKTITLVDKWR